MRSYIRNCRINLKIKNSIQLILISLSVNTKLFAQGNSGFFGFDFPYYRIESLFNPGDASTTRVRSNGFGGITHPTSANILNCDNVQNITFRVFQGTFSTQTLLNNRNYRVRFRLQRNGVDQGNEITVAINWIGGLTNGVHQFATDPNNVTITRPTEPGSYRWRMTLDIQNAGGGWSNNIDNAFTLAIAINVPVTTNFTVNGVSAPNSAQPVQLCSSLLGNNQVNASGFQCEKDYFMSIEECDLWWGRSFINEWFFSQNSTLPTTAFSLGAIHNLVSVPISSIPVGNNSVNPVYPNFLGGTTTGNFNLQGGVFTSGNLIGQARYYIVIQ